MNRAVIVICDSLRRDLITPADAPFLCELGQRSAQFVNHAGVFPSTTRTSAASIATGCLPARHGLLGNTMALDEGDGLVCLSVGKPDFRDRLHRATGRTLHMPTMAERLARAGESAIAFSNVSPGAAYFLDPDGHGWVYNAAGSFGPGRRSLPAARGARGRQGRRRRHRRNRALLRRGSARARAGAGLVVAVGARLHRPPHAVGLAGASRGDRQRRRKCPPGRRNHRQARSRRRRHPVRHRLGSRHGERRRDDRPRRAVGRGRVEARAGIVGGRRRPQRHRRTDLFCRAGRHAGCRGRAVSRNRAVGRPRLHRRRSRRNRLADGLAGADCDHPKGRRPRQPAWRAATATSSAIPRSQGHHRLRPAWRAWRQRAAPVPVRPWRRLCRAEPAQRSSLVDIAPTVLRHLGLAAAGLDGRPLPRHPTAA